MDLYSVIQVVDSKNGGWVRLANCTSSLPGNYKASASNTLSLPCPLGSFTVCISVCAC